MTQKNKNIIYILVPLLIVATYSAVDRFSTDLFIYIASFYPKFINALNSSYSMMDTFITLVLLLVCFPIYKFLTKNKITLKPMDSKLILGCIPLSLALGGMSFIVLLILEHFFVPFGILEKSFLDFTAMWDEVDNEAYFWVFLSIVFLGSIFEEILFRGIIYNLLEKYKFGLFPAVVSGILFGIWHGQSVQTIYTALMGIVLGYVYMRTKNLFYPILLHILNNLYSTLPPSLESDFIYTAINYISILMVIPFVYILALDLIEYKKNNKLT